RFVDRAATALARAVGSGPDPPERRIDLVEQIPEVVAERQIALALERERAGVCRLFVEGDLAGQVGLGLVERSGFQLVEFPQEQRALHLQLGADLLKLGRTEGGLAGLARRSLDD